MSSTAAPSQALPPQEILADIKKKQEENRSSAKLNFGLLAAGLVLSGTMSLLFPPAGVPGFLGTFGVMYASLKGWSLLENFGTGKSLEKATKEAAEGAILTQTLQRGTKLAKFAKNALRTTLGLFGVAAAAAAVGWLAPVLLPAVFTSAVVSGAVVLGLVGATVTSVLDGANHGATAVLAIAQARAVPEKAAAPVAERQPSVLSAVLSTAPEFGVAAKAKQAIAAPEAAIAAKPPATVPTP